MSTEIRTKLAKLNIAITPRFTKNLDKLIVQYEIRKEHPLVLNNSEIGVHKIAFTTNDRAMLFDICDIYETEVSHIIKDIKAIDNSFRVISDPFNILCIYLSHLISKSKLKSKDKEKAQIQILTYWQYKMFTSIINHYFPYGANDDIMKQVIENLSRKYEIKLQGSWKKLMLAKSAVLIEKGSLHHKAINTLHDDRKVLYIITDVQTRLRSQLKNITALYYELKETNNYMRSTSATVEVDGKRILRESSAGFESISHRIYMKMGNKSSFVNDKYISMLVAVQKTVSKGLLTRTINQLVDTASVQANDGSDDKLINRKDGSKTFVGLSLLTKIIVQCIYDNAIKNDKVNLNNKLDIFEATKSLFSAHQPNNELLLNTKGSIAHFIKENRLSSRDSTVSTLSISISLYICLMSFEHL